MPAVEALPASPYFWAAAAGGRAAPAEAGAALREVHAAQQLLQWKQALCVHHLQQAELKVEALLLLVTYVAMGSQHDLQKAREFLFAELRRDRQPLVFFHRC